MKIKIKTQDLIGAQLDWAVAKCEGVNLEAFALYYEPTELGDLDGHGFPKFHYSTIWSQGGPIIERQEIELSKWGVDGWEARDTNYQFLNTPQEHAVFVEGCGPTPLIAAMRCYCCSKFGDEVEVPDELSAI